MFGFLFGGFRLDVLVLRTSGDFLFWALVKGLCVFFGGDS